jgi:hypothetical protein
VIGNALISETVHGISALLTVGLNVAVGVSVALGVTVNVAVADKVEVGV